ncbi:hypothetical protein GCK32_020529 [Trichostrongylus colubriformis]|uniref:Uncharacterized protein n=1 Tax=Trichostrongylus colubriformis TaxID=6319 RepID=A0AAN8FBC7_TRICO
MPRSGGSSPELLQTGISRLTFIRQTSKQKQSDGSKSPERQASPILTDRPTLTRSRSRRLAGFASRSLRKSQWRLFKHRAFFGSQHSTAKQNNHL